MPDSMMDMSVSTAAVIGLIALFVILVGLFVTFRVLGGREHEGAATPARVRSRHRRERPVPR